MPITPAAVELLRDVAPKLSAWGRVYLFGAQAVLVHGVPRLSADVDVTIKLSRDDPAAFAADVGKGGFTLRVPDGDFIRRTHVLPFVHDATGMPLDIVLAGSGLEEEFLDRARSADLGGVVVPVIRADDLIVAKILAGRPKDMEDVRGVWRALGHSLDAGRIRRILRDLEQALGQSDLLPAFESML